MHSLMAGLHEQPQQAVHAAGAARHGHCCSKRSGRPRRPRHTGGRPALPAAQAGRSLDRAGAGARARWRAACGGTRMRTAHPRPTPSCLHICAPCIGILSRKFVAIRRLYSKGWSLLRALIVALFSENWRRKLGCTRRSLCRHLLTSSHPCCCRPPHRPAVISRLPWLNY